MRWVIKLLFGLWYALSCMMLLMDMFSYTKLMGADSFQMMNREYDVAFGFMFIYLPFIILGAYTFLNVKHNNDL